MNLDGGPMQILIDLILKLFGLWLARPSSLAAEAEKAGAATAEHQTAETDNVDIAKAVAASRQALAAASAAGGMRTPADPDCRDCKA
jgi:hypothetical protein